jgi:hypothetical protein
MSDAPRAIGDDIWHVTGPALLMPGGARMPAASTILRLPDRSLAIYSPIAFAPATAAAIDALGEVAHVIAPSALHHMFAGAAAARWPGARVHAAPSVRAKAPSLRVDRALGEPEPAWAGALDVERIDGAPGIDEHVVFHRASGTLVVSDFLFHVRRPPNLRMRMILWMVGAGGGRLAQSRVWRFARKDRAAARASVERILAWPVAQLAPCHGEPCPLDPDRLASLVTRVAGGPIARPALPSPTDPTPPQTLRGTAA